METDLIDRALAEDVGDGDATTEATVDAAAPGVATITPKAPGVISGLAVAEAVFLRLDPDANPTVCPLQAYSRALGFSRMIFRCCASRARRGRSSPPSARR